MLYRPFSSTFLLYLSSCFFLCLICLLLLQTRNYDKGICIQPQWLYVCVLHRWIVCGFCCLLFFLSDCIVSSSLILVDAVTSKHLASLDVPNVLELDFSPNATYLSTWERMIKLPDETQHKNLKIWNISQLQSFSSSSSSQRPEPAFSFSQRSQECWKLQFTQDESAMLRAVNNEIHVYNPANFEAGIVNKLHLDGVTSFVISPGPNPNIAAFVAQKKVYISSTS